MTALSEEVRQAWQDREGPAILATVSPDGIPNIIYVTCVGSFGKDRLVVADNYFDKTRKNLQADNKAGAILFQGKDGKPYQVKGTLEYHTAGEIFNDMKRWNPTEHPGHAAAVLNIESVYSGAEKVC